MCAVWLLARSAAGAPRAGQRQCGSEVGVHADMVSVPDCSPRRASRACGIAGKIQTHPDADWRGRSRRPREFFLTRASILYWNPVVSQDVPDYPEIRHHPTCIRGRKIDCAPRPQNHIVVAPSDPRRVAIATYAVRPTLTAQGGR